MKKTEQNIFTILKQKMLSDRERSVMFSKLNEHRAHKPITAETTDQLKQFTETTRARFGIVSHIHPMPMVASLLIFAFVGAGTAAAAETTLPGDLLYPIKTQVTENIRAQFATNNEARVDFETWRAERRLNETKKLVARAALTDKIKDRLEEQFVRHANQVEVNIATIAQTDTILAAKLAVKFEATLAAHDALLADSDPVATESTRNIVRENINRIARVRVRATENIGVAFSDQQPIVDTAAARTMMMESTETTAETKTQLPITKAALPSDVIEKTDQRYKNAAQQMFVASEKTFVATKELYKRKESSFTDEQQQRIEAQFEKTTQMFNKAKTAYENGLYEQAYANFKNVFSSMNELLVFLKNNTYLDSAYQKTTPINPAPPQIKIDREYRPQIDPSGLERGAETADTPIY